MFNLNKKAEVGETITWFVATMVIALILAVFLGISYYLSLTRSISNIDVSRGTDFKEGDLFLTKSFSGYLMTVDANGKRIYEDIQTDKNLNSQNGKFAKDLSFLLFGNFQGKPRLWIYVIINNKKTENTFFDFNDLTQFKSASSDSSPFLESSFGLDVVKTTNVVYAGTYANIVQNDKYYLKNNGDKYK